MDARWPFGRLWLVTQRTWVPLNKILTVPAPCVGSVKIGGVPLQNPDYRTTADCLMARNSDPMFHCGHAEDMLSFRPTS